MCKTEKSKKKSHANYIYPKYVFVEQSDGQIVQVLYKDIIKQEEFIIEDNIGYGLLHDYTDEEIDEYEEEAYAQLKELKKQIRENPQVVLALDLPTWRYVVKSEKP